VPFDVANGLSNPCDIARVGETVCQGASKGALVHLWTPLDKRSLQPMRPNAWVGETVCRAYTHVYVRTRTHPAHCCPLGSSGQEPTVRNLRAWAGAYVRIRTYAHVYVRIRTYTCVSARILPTAAHWAAVGRSPRSSGQLHFCNCPLCNVKLRSIGQIGQQNCKWRTTITITFLYLQFCCPICPFDRGLTLQIGQ